MNAATSTDWASAVAILLSGLILGSTLIYFFGRKRSVVAPRDAQLTDLESRRDVLVQQIRELDVMSTDERTRLEIETAGVLREIDERKARGAVVAAEPTTPHPSPDSRSATISFVWGFLTAAALGGLAYLVVRSTSERQPQQVAQQTETVQAAQPQRDPALRAIEETVQRQPDNLDMRIELAKAYLERENLMGVFEQTQFVLGKSPNDSRALTYQALVRMAMGDAASARNMLQKATSADPNFLDARVALAWILTQENKPAEAEKAMQEAIRRHPEEKTRLEEVMAQMRAHPPESQARRGGELPEGHPQIGTAAGGGAVAQGAAIHVTIDIDPAAKSRLGANGIVFLFARAEGVATGPPAAAKRLAASALPVTLDLSSADSMMGQPLPPRMRLEARADADGIPTTKDPNDPVAMMDGVQLGSSVTLRLK